MGWQPIETAPRDGSRFLVSDGKVVLLGGRSFMCTGKLTEADFWHAQNNSGWNPTYKINLTHWMPLPALPVPAGNASPSERATGPVRAMSAPDALLNITGRGEE